MSPSPQKERFNFRQTRGKGKGRFVKRSVAIKTEKLLQAKMDKAEKSASDEAIEKENIEENPKEKLTIGYRVVDLNVLATYLWCKDCDTPLSLRDIIHESRIGLASILTIPCSLCKAEYKVPTNKTVAPDSNEFIINTNIATGIENGSIDKDVLDKVLSILEIPNEYID